MSNPEIDNVAKAPNDRAVFLKLKTESIYNQLQALGRKLNDHFLSDLNTAQLNIYIELIDRHRHSFDATHCSLEEMDFNQMGSELSDNFAMAHVLIKAAVQGEIDKRRATSSPHSSTMKPVSAEDTQSIVVVSHPKSRLPELQLPNFSGAYTEWIDFFSMFTTVVDKESELTNVEKFQHLKSCLTGSALDTIRSLEIKNDNYDLALDLLKKRFDNKRLIFQAHIREIFGLKRVEVSSADKLRELCDKLNSHLRALQNMATKEQIADCIVMQIMMQKIDERSQAKWEETSPSSSIPTWDFFASFLEKRCQALENVDYAMVNRSHSNQVGKTKLSNSKNSFMTSRQPTYLCIFCNNQSHTIYNCPRFANLSINLRLREAKRLALCLNCLKKGHRINTCKSSNCRHCQSKHHTLLHFENNPIAHTDSSVEPAPVQVSNSIAQYQQHALSATLPPTLFTANSPTPSSDVVLLATAVIFVKNRAGSHIPCRALLDSGSQLHFITTRFANQLQLKKTTSPVTVSGIGDTNLSTENYTVNVSLQSQNSDFSTAITAVVTPMITDKQPAINIYTSDWKLPSNIKLADPSFNKASRIDLLLGASIFFELLCVGQIHLAPGLPILQKTSLGWIVSGGGHQPSKCVSLIANNKSDIFNTSEPALEDVVRQFWEMEGCTDTVLKISKENIDCENHFKSNYARLNTGEYSVRLPLKMGIDCLGDSFQQAKRRFINLERKLSRNADVKAQYSAFIKEYLSLNHMSPVKPEVDLIPRYFLPHHCVFKDDSSTTKLRVVFDGSAVTTSGYSLNDVLMSGPTIQPKLFTILLRFRFYPVALTGDICKMYRCVRIHPSDSFLQCILWRDSPQDDLQIFKMGTVTYGTKPASFLAIRSMQQLAMDESEAFPLGSKTVLRDFYVDDMISGGNSVSEVLTMMQQTKTLLAKGHFLLRKWCTNNEQVRQEIPEYEREKFLKFNDSSNVTKALGLIWDPSSDNFLFSLSVEPHLAKTSKRTVLSIIARFYDPLGLIGPVITKLKIFLQRLWRHRLAWDESLPQGLETQWSDLCTDFNSIQQLTFPRYVLHPDATLEIHAFGDASLEAFGACVYARSIQNGISQVNLLCSKSRVAPLKSLTIPKLELCAAVLLAQLVHTILEMGTFQGKIHCWSDSAVVLSWIKDESSKFNVFVANRVSMIQQLTTDMEWHYIPSGSNPADILSKGASPTELARSHLWKHGPSFLIGSREEWPQPISSPQTIPEIRKRALITSTFNDVTSTYKYINTFATMQRIFAYVYKFIARIRSCSILPLHIQRGTFLLIKQVQRASLSAEYKLLSSKQLIFSAKSRLSSLTPFLDEYGLLRVGGRLRNSALDFAARHPIILPKNHPLTSSIITYFHTKYFHAGPQSLLATIRLQYWPLGGRKTVARILNKCTLCFRAKPRVIEHIMGELPKERVISSSRAFVTTGIDYCGPFYYQPDVRNKRPTKCYISLFICFNTKAVHLELVKDLTTASFIAALKRFIALRGRPKAIWSDNATNFVGAKNELADLKRLFLSNEHQNAIHDYCLNEHINWQCIPPRSPHFGGLCKDS